MTYIWYPDLFFLVNFGMDLMAFYVAAVSFGIPGRVKRAICAAAISGGCTTLLFYVLKEYLLFRILVHGVVNPLLVGFFFSPADGRDFLKKWGSIYLLLLLFGGVQMWVRQAAPSAAAAEILSFCLCAFCGAAVLFFWKIRRRDASFVWVCLYWKGKRMKCRAYLDTGNVLSDPYTGKPVSILGKEQMREAFGDELPGQAPRLIPYRTVGEENGLLSVYTMDKMIIYEGREKYTSYAPVIGVSARGCMIGKSRCLLLNSECRGGTKKWRSAKGGGE